MKPITPFSSAHHKLNYQTKILSLNPLGYWDCNDQTTGTGVLIDSSKNALHGNIGSNVTINSSGVINSALSSNGTVSTTRRSIVPNSVYDWDSYTSPFSLIVWWYANDFNTYGVFSISEKVSIIMAKQFVGQWIWSVNSTVHLDSSQSRSASWGSSGTPDSLWTNRWHMFGITYNGSGVVFSVNGRSSSPYSTGGLGLRSASHQKGLLINAANVMAEQNFNGSCDEVAFFDHCISTQDMKVLFELSGKPDCAITTPVDPI